MLKRIAAALAHVRSRAFAPVDIASLVVFRIAFGLLSLWHLMPFFAHDWVRLFWLEPRFLFKYYGFSWVQPWPGNGLYIHCAVLAVLAVFIAIGFLYRISAALFFLGHIYIFLLDETRYQNHDYLICLFSFLLIFVPAHRAFSIDALLKQKLRTRVAPAWSLWVLRIQIAVVYIYGGIAKINPDWLRGEPMRSELTHHLDFPILGRFFTEEWAVYMMSYGSLLFDLLVVPCLLWRRTRVAAFCVAVVFHLMNARLFSLGVGVFPWLAIAATGLFFSPSWPRRIISIFRLGAASTATADTEPFPSRPKQIVVLSFVTIYSAIQILFPLSPFLFPGGSEWSLMEHRFCWRMMLRSQSIQGNFYVTDPNIDRTYRVAPPEFLTPAQIKRIYWQPDTILQFAHYLAENMPRAGPKPLEVQARVFVSINRRRPELFVDPRVDLAKQSRTLMRPSWLLPIREPLPPPGKDFSNDLFAPP
jgi:vitamin K-dependent gamma-carboxylase-like protein